ncbi:MAG: carbamoyltransferase C-terminal domain-containing protein [Bacteroidota bacterium]|nr:carbamoyltransferase C-terminal domain-containing protein [Bacteroidota bacterium]
MFILGINAYHADSSAAIFKDGVLIAATEEERFRRIKHWAGLPSQAIEFCLKEAGISLREVDHVAIGRDPGAKLFRKLLFLLRNPSGSWKAIAERISNSKKVTSLESALFHIDPSVPIAELKSRIHQVEHHRSHLASAFFASPFKESAIFSIDGSGDFTTTMMAMGKDSGMEILNSIDFPHSVGVFYTAFTQWLGFPHYGDEYKVMGLAPYGDARYTDKLREVLLFEPNGVFKLDLGYFRSPREGYISYDDHLPIVAQLYSDKLIESFGPARKKEEPLSQYHKDVAASVQRITEELIFHCLNDLYNKTKCENICVAGGVAQNSVANGKITRNTAFKHVYIPSAGHDAGISMGAGLYVNHQILGKPRTAPIRTAYTGSSYSNSEIKAFLADKNLKYEYLEDDLLYERVADCIHQGGVVGWFSGRAEFGPRALGGRSILADPTRADAKEILNTKVKRRESFRPFAPSILKEYVQDYFEVNDEVPFMEKVFPIRKEKQHLIPAVTHVDGTGRLQTVDRQFSPRYYALIEAFSRRSGIPILLNTSFNENEPIVNSPANALDCFLRTDMDLLALENYIIYR